MTDTRAARLAPPEPHPSFTSDLRARVAALPLAAKLELVTGRTPWRLHAAESIGLRELVVSDGPVGIRGTEEVAGETSLCLPSPSAIAATWDPELARRAGSVHAAEARRHGVDVILAPVVNLQRTPVGGRHFEFQSEDPLLSGRMAAAIVDGIQSGGVGVCLKHFVGNESETLRTEYLARIDQRTLREVYLAPFEYVVAHAQPWSVMAAYNRVDDGVESAPAVAHHRLLTQVLKDEWGFDGLVISDWTAARSTVEPALGGLDLVMPGPAGPWSRGQLLAAVEAGEVPEEFIDDKVLRVLLLACRVGGLAGYPAPVPVQLVPETGEDDFVRELAARTIVVLADAAGALPVAEPADVGSIALIGPNAVEPFVLGGGSAQVRLRQVHTAAEAFAEAFPNAEITLLAGAHSRPTPPVADPDRLRDPVTGRPGMRLVSLDRGGAELATETFPGADFFRKGGFGADTVRLRLSTQIDLTEPGEHWVGLGTPAAHRIWIDGELVARDDTELTGGEVLLRSLHHHAPFFGRSVTGPAQVLLEAEVQCFADDYWDRFGHALVHHLPPGPGSAEQLAEAVAAARAADLAVLVVGTNAQVESEGFDRTGLELPGGQNDLVAAVLDARPDAIVVVNAGAPVVLPWLDRARTVLWTWFPGQEGGRGIADVLSGRTEPAGRLPWTLPGSYADVPVPDAVPVGEDLVVDYAEGVDIGYRGWLRAGRAPARPFGFGLGWTSWEYAGLRLADTAAGDLEVTLEVTNTGDRAGHETVQAYLEGPAGDGSRPVRWLAGFAGAEATPGQTVQVGVTIPRRAFEVWDVAGEQWVTPAGEYRLLLGRNLDDVRQEAAVRR